MPLVLLRLAGCGQVHLECMVAVCQLLQEPWLKSQAWGWICTSIFCRSCFWLSSADSVGISDSSSSTMEPETAENTSLTVYVICHVPAKQHASAATSDFCSIACFVSFRRCSVAVLAHCAEIMRNSRSQLLSELRSLFCHRDAFDFALDF